MSQKIIDVRIAGNQINISGAISLKLRISDAFEYIGNQEIIIYGTSKVFHYVFANYTTNLRQDRFISKLFFLQYEYYLPEFEYSYNYKSTDIIEFGGISWQRDNSIDRTTLEDWKHNSDVFQLITFLEKKKLKFPNLVFTNRLALMLNEEKTQELLILYNEKITEEKRKQLYSHGQIIDHEWQKEIINLNKSGTSVFSVL